MQEDKIFVEQRLRFTDKADSLKRVPYFVVTKLVNTVTFHIGEELSKRSIKELVRNGATVTITGPKESGS